MELVSLNSWADTVVNILCHMWITFFFVNMNLTFGTNSVGFIAMIATLANRDVVIDYFDC